MDLTAVFGAADTLDEAALFQAVDEADGAVMAEDQVVGELADSGRAVVVKAFDGEEQLVLLVPLGSCPKVDRRRMPSVQQLGWPAQCRARPPAARVLAPPLCSM